MKVNWHDVATIVVTMIALGGVMMAALRGFFVTTKACANTQDKCQASICHKIDELKKDVKENRNIVSTQYAEIKEVLGELKNK